MYASTKKQTPIGTLVFIGVLIIGLAVGGYFLYAYWKAQQASSLEISLNPAPEPDTPSPAPTEISELTNQLAEAKNIQETLQKENEVLLTTIEALEINQAKSEQLKIGREVMSDFAARFFKYETVLNNQSFFQFFNKLVLDYIENRAITVREMKTSDPLFKRIHQEFVAWVIALEEEEIQALAFFVGFDVIEHLYHLPLTLLASGLSSEIEVIDFQLPVLVSGAETPPIRDENGELTMKKRAHLDGYTSAQQFLYRRGPKFTAKVMVFLQAYLAYEGY